MRGRDSENSPGKRAGSSLLAGSRVVATRPARARRTPNEAAQAEIAPPPPIEPSVPVTETAADARARMGHIFVGREIALATLAELNAHARAGRGRLVVLCAEAGIGKTTLLEHTGESFGGQVARARALQSDNQLAYAPWREIVAALLDGAEQAMVAPGLRADLETFAAGAAPGDLAEGSPATSFALSRAIGNLVRACGPALIALDDFHWADPASWHLLERLAASVEKLPLLLVAALRDGEAAPEDLGRLLRLGTMVQLEPFSREEALALIDALGAPRNQLDELMRSSGGSPFLLTDMIIVRRGTQNQRVSLAGRFFLRERIESLGSECVEVLQLLALMGQPTTPEQIACHSLRDEARVVELLADAVRAGVLQKTTVPPNSHDFLHDLYRQAVLSEMPAGTQRRLHFEIARTLGADGEIARGPAASVAHHLLEATGLVDPERTNLWCLRAGREAMAAGDPLRAVK